MVEWNTLEASLHAQNTTNPIRKIVDQMKPPTGLNKSFIPLSIGDPTTDGNFLPPPEVIAELQSVAARSKCNGYGPSTGTAGARSAVAKYWKNFTPSLSPVEADKLLRAENVVLGSGASHSLLMAITALCNPGDNLLIPAPCFSLYGTICGSYGIEVRHYPCDSQNNWECDINAIATLRDEKTKAILINNPSNPCGSNFTRAHVKQILETAEKLRLPVIADEIYAGMVFGTQTFTSVSDIETTVPRFIVGGIAKNYMVPGWRLGWVLVMDPLGVAAKVLDGIVQLSTLIVGPNSLIQGVLPLMLDGINEAYRLEVNRNLEAGATAAFNIFSRCKGLRPTTPQGAMYLMVQIEVEQFGEEIQNGVDFAKLLLTEENVQVLPGEIFQMPNFFRVVFTKPIHLVEEAVCRIEDFCRRHEKQ